MNADISATPSSPPLIRLERVYAGFGATPFFRELSLSIHAGRHLALIGPNASGKSTLLRLLQGELRPMPNLPPERPGRILFSFDGYEDSSILNARTHVRTVSPAMQRNYVRQGWKISGEEILLSGLDNAAMLYGELSAAYYDQAAELAAQAGASHLLGIEAPAMSQGQLRLTLILRALMNRPALLLLDEPFDGLDAQARRAVSRSINLAMARGSTVLVSAHRPDDIPEGITEALVINAGKVEYKPLFSLQALFNENDAPVGPPTISGSGSVCPFAPDRPLFQFSNVDVFIERKQVLYGIDWSVRKGERWVVSGRNGSGKSTLLRLLYGEEFAAYGGSVLWCGKARPGLEELRRGVGYVSDRLQDVYDYDLCAEEVVISGLRGHIGLYEEPLPEERALAKAWLTRLGLEQMAALPFFSLSSGAMRRVLLARALASRPPLLLLDEPCSGLDASSRTLFFRSLEDAAGLGPARTRGERGVTPPGRKNDAAMHGTTLIYVSHHEQDLGSLFTHELRLEAGRVVFAGPRG
ncbi:MAG: ATP-binding cassette domain-containing protein [Desulfovibrionaceae bacterium]|nr:ATP-binding cassette domain-containing protein [Desulfovibrionaceae bacterium]